MIEQEERAWGVVLTLQPLSDWPLMRIVGEVDKPKAGRPPETRFWFHGAQTEKPLRMTDLKVWQQGLHQFIQEVKDVSAQLVAKSKRKKKT